MVPLVRLLSIAQSLETFWLQHCRKDRTAALQRISKECPFLRGRESQRLRKRVGRNGKRQRGRLRPDGPLNC